MISAVSCRVNTAPSTNLIWGLALPSDLSEPANGVLSESNCSFADQLGTVLRRLSEAARRRDGARSRPRLRVDGPVPDRSRIYADMAKLFLQDLANVESGIYPLPEDHDGPLFTLIARSRLFFADLPAKLIFNAWPRNLPLSML